MRVCEQLEPGALPPELSPYPRRMAAQFGLRALAKRCLVLHGSKVVALCCFGAAMQVRETCSLSVLWWTGHLGLFGAAQSVGSVRLFGQRAV